MSESYLMTIKTTPAASIMIQTQIAAIGIVFPSLSLASLKSNTLIGYSVKTSKKIELVEITCNWSRKKDAEKTAELIRDIYKDTTVTVAKAKP